MLNRLIAELLNKLRASKPPEPAAAYRRALEHFKRGEDGAAGEICTQLIAADPGFAPALDLLGAIAGRSEDLDAMEPIVRRILALQPGESAIHLRLGVILRAKGLCHEAIACFRAALALEPQNQEAQSALLSCMMFAHGLSAAEIFAECRRYGERVDAATAGARTRAHPNGCDPSRPLRLGYVAFDFGNRINQCYLRPLFAAHDRSQYKIFLYDNSQRGSSATAALEFPGDTWRGIAGLSDEQAAAQIRGDEIDILVDLSGHLMNHRLLTFALKPAPLQMAWLSYPQTTGLSAIDYRITDRYCDPPGVADGHSVEKLLRLPDSYWCYAPPLAAPPGPLPALERGCVTFGSFNNMVKLSPPTLELWARLLGQVADSRLVMLCVPSVETEQRVRKVFERAGIAGERLTMHRRLAKEPYWRSFQEVDIALDPFPYTGATTTLDALWMGLPVVSLAGDRCASRAGVSLLSSAGRPQWIAGDAGRYLEIARDLAADLPRLAAIRRELQEWLPRSPLADGQRFARNMESLYRLAWRNWCESRAAAPPLQAPGQPSR
jgi:protein O-GlcNAc transferase